MVGERSKPPDEARKAILEQLQLSDHRILTRSEIMEAFDDTSKKTVSRYLNWMVDEEMIHGRQLMNSDTWVYAISVGHSSPVSAEESVLTASKAGSHLKTLFKQRREFQVIALGLAALWMLVTIAISAAVTTALGLNILPMETIVTIAAALFSTGVLLIFSGLWIFPIETIGSWPRALEQGQDESD